MASWQVALVREQGVEFGVVVVQDQVIHSANKRDDLLRAWAAELRRPVALMSDRSHQTYGRQDIVKWLSNIDPSRLPWRKMTIN